MTCGNCGYQSHTFQPFLMLSIPIPTRDTTGKDIPKNHKFHLKDCLKHYSEIEEKVEWRCPNCEIENDSSKRITCWKLPQILIIHLKRFGHKKHRGSRKIHNSVECPEEMSFEDVFDPEVASIDKHKYNLVSTINHHGTIGGGHYTADVLNEHPVDHVKRWYCMNDSIISYYNPDEVNHDDSYILLYEK